MKRKEITIKSKDKIGSMTTLVEKYTDQLISQQQPDPQRYLDEYSNKAKKEDLKTHINIATLLTTHGLAHQKRARKIMKNKKRIEESKRKLLNILSKNSGGGR